MNDLLLISFKAQCRYVEARIHDKKKLKDFLYTKNCILTDQKHYMLNNSYTYNEGCYMADDIYQETKRNLTARFVTGIPLEGSYYEY